MEHLSLIHILQQNGDIGEKIQNSRNIIVPEAETAPDLQQRADQLAHTLSLIHICQHTENVNQPQIVRHRQSHEEYDDGTRCV